jgi:hypothetical protein
MAYSEFALEKYKGFQVIAWALFIGFAVFVGLIARDLFQTTAQVSAVTERTTGALNASSNLDNLDEIIGE